ncbi:MAG TPA: SHOCT domain-containing protein [Gaiellaceae bacterium]|nr:SHOCT domain-containing protein [Gaiellaceae bacterium]
MLASVIAAMFSAFITGALARFAVPGPDPMPAWLTIAIGFAGTAIGWGIVYGTVGHDASWAGIASFLAAIALVVLYRRFVQKRPLWGPDAYRFPDRGFGVEAYRERLKRAGIDPEKVGLQFSGLQPAPHVQPPPGAGPGPVADPTENPAHYLGLLEELHDAGVLDDDEFASARTRLLERLRG